MGSVPLYPKRGGGKVAAVFLYNNVGFVIVQNYRDYGYIHRLEFYITRNETKLRGLSPLLSEVSANFFGYGVLRGQRDASLRPYSRLSRPEPHRLEFYITRNETKLRGLSQLLSQVSANFCGYRVLHGQRDASLRPYSLFSRPEPHRLEFYITRNETKLCGLSPLLSEVSANFFGYRVLRGQSDGSLRPYSRISRPETLLFLPNCSSVLLTTLSGPRSRSNISQKIW
jgi:hypothetical protein